ncbi:MAG: hypothetical protein JWR80_8347 [Bradyrhizobium sp.]|nr:hypothetical protein [Bradyrhizobium sp.]
MNTTANWLTAGGTSQRLRLAILILFHTVVCCVSLVYVAQYEFMFHIFYDPARLAGAITVVAAFALVSYLFIIADFSFGYFLGFYFYTMVLGYLWLNCFSDLPYNHRLGGLSAAASAVAFLIPALFISSPVRQRLTLSAKQFDRLLTFSLVLAAITIAISASYNFRLVSIGRIYEFRSDLEFPRLLTYWIGITSNALLPFAFGCFVVRRNYWRAGITLVLLLLFYPITLSKLAFFTPAWLLVITMLLKMCETRTTVILSLFAPMLLGVILIAIFHITAVPYLELVNFRMIATPSNAIDIYNDFFSRHDLTYFCQVRVLKTVIDCPYQEQLSIVMAKAYELGNFNASLFSTEGIASVGPLFAPVPVFACGLVIALANRLSSGLPPRFILISSAALPQILLNVPLTTTLLSHGAAILFLLWYITPRSYFRPDSTREAAPA